MNKEIRIADNKHDTRLMYRCIEEMDVWTMHWAISQSNGNGIINKIFITDSPKALHVARAAGQVCEVLMWR